MTKNNSLSFLRYLFISMMAGAITISAYIMIWLSIPGSAVIHPISWSYDRETGMATFARSVRWPSPVLAAWTTEISRESGDNCHASGVSRYEPWRDVVSYPVQESLRRCLDGGETVAIVFTWTPKLFGLIPLRPAMLGVPRSALDYGAR